MCGVVGLFVRRDTGTDQVAFKVVLFLSTVIMMVVPRVKKLCRRAGLKRVCLGMWFAT